MTLGSHHRERDKKKTPKSIDEFIYMGEIVNKKESTNEEVTKESSTYINNIIKINKLKNNKTVSSKKKI